MPSQYQYNPPVLPTNARSRRALDRFRRFLGRINHTAVLSRVQQGDTVANAHNVIDTFLDSQQDDLDRMFSVLDRMSRLQVPAADLIQLGPELAVIDWPSVNGNASGNGASRSI
jgi:hypothetical protein